MQTTPAPGRSEPSATLPAPRRRSPGRLGIALVLGVGLSVALPLWAFRGVDLAHAGSWRASVAAWNCCWGRRSSWLAWHCAAGAGEYCWRPSKESLFGLVYRESASVYSRIMCCRSAWAIWYAPGFCAIHEGGSGARALGTVAVERVLDLLTLVFLLGAYVVVVGVDRPELLVAGQLALLGGVCLSLVLVVGYWRRMWLQRLIAAPIRWFSPRLGDQVMQLLGGFLDGLQVFVSLRQTAQVLLLSAAWWASAVATYYFVGQALGSASCRGITCW